MYPKPQTYPAIYIIFTLLSAIRRGVQRKNIWREFRRQGVALKPRLSFWVAVCRQAGLIRTDDALRITSHAQRWLNKTPEEQAFHLIESWQNAPNNHRVRRFRKKLLWKLKYGRRSGLVDKQLTKKDRAALGGLNALGLTENGELTQWGIFFIRCEGVPPSPKPVDACHVHENRFIAHLPSHVNLLWELERFLQPQAPGVYPLIKRSLQFFDGDPYTLIELLERGLGNSISERIKAMILNQPSIRISKGIVLEFSSPAELKKLRRQPVFRKYIDEFLSPQRVLVSHEKAKELFKILGRRGVYADREEERLQGGKKRTHFREAYQPQSVIKPFERGVPMMSILERYKQLELALDILYRVPGYPAEQRRITPLLIEERGEHIYVIAYCHASQPPRPISTA